MRGQHKCIACISIGAPPHEIYRHYPCRRAERIGFGCPVGRHDKLGRLEKLEQRDKLDRIEYVHERNELSQLAKLFKYFELQQFGKHDGLDDFDERSELVQRENNGSRCEVSCSSPQQARCSKRSGAAAPSCVCR